MRIDLRYGRSVVSLQVPDRNVQEIIRPWQGPQGGDAAAGLRDIMNGQAGAFGDEVAGKRVCVLERRHVLGGAATTEELWPGYKVSTAAYVVSLLLPEIIRDLRLAEYGFRVLPRSPSSFTPLPTPHSRGNRSMVRAGLPPSCVG